MPTLSQDLALLEARGLVRAAAEQSTRVFRFKHALTRQATYETILQSRRAELHRAAAETLAALAPQPDLEMTLTIAEHWQRAGEDVETLKLVLPRAQALVYTGRGSSLTALLTRLDREKLSETQRRDLDIVLADAHAARGEYGPARTLYDRVIPQADTVPLQIMLRQRRGTAAYHLGDYQAAQRDYNETLDLALEHNDPLHQARAHSGLGLVAWSRGDVDAALTRLETSRSIALSLGKTLELANIEFNLAGVLLDQGKYREAILAGERAFELHQELDSPLLAARTLQLLGACHYSFGHLNQAKTYYERALYASNEADDRLGLALAHNNLGEVCVAQNEFENAMAEYERAIVEFRTLKLDFFLAGSLANLAEVQALVAAREDSPSYVLAESNIAEALEIAARINSPERQGIAHRVRAEIFLAQNNPDAAVTHAQDAVELLEHIRAGLELDKARRTRERVRAKHDSR